MVSSSGAAARDTRVDDLDRLTERALEAEAVRRAALAATLFSRAENLATQLHPDDTCLIPAWLRFKRAASLRHQAILAMEAVEGTPRMEAAALLGQTWQPLRSVVAVVERRSAAGTTVRSERGARRLRGLDSLTLTSPRRRSMARAATRRWRFTDAGWWLKVGQTTGCLSQMETLTLVRQLLATCSPFWWHPTLLQN